MAGIRAQIIPARGVRITKESIADFPAVDITAELYDLGDKDSERINSLYAQVADSMAALKVRKELDKSPDHPLTKMLRAKQEIELLKVPVAAELAQDYLDKGCSVAIFVNFSATLAELRKRLKTDCIIDGATSDADRLASLDNFQENKARSILLNSNAGNASLSLHDKYGVRTATVGIVFPGHDAVILQQIFGRLPRHGGKSNSIYRVIFAAKSVEIPMHRAVSSKLNNLSALNDADLRPDSLAFASV
jgi:superfamily II DNA or RNA helicase